MFTEVRTAALLQKVMHGADVLNAGRALRLATIDGARALGLDGETGSLEAGKRADVIIVRLDNLHSTPRFSDIPSLIVYSSQASDVRTVIIDGRLIMHERKLQTMNEREVIEEANREANLLLERAGIAQA
jgi:cytosine/adenosine deaminase-related metal-dependent hydrolase